MKIASANPAASGGVVTTVRIAVAFLLLNLLLSFENWWPTPAVLPDSRMAPELVGIWVVLLGLAWRGRTLSLRAAAVLGVVTLLLVIGRYGDVTVPALFGRSINLYWDGHQIPIVLSVLARKVPWWVPPVIVAAVITLLWALYQLIRWAIRVLGDEAAARALKSPTALTATAVAVVLVALNLAGVQATWPYVSKPILPTYARQANLLMQAYFPGAQAASLPAAPSFEGHPDLLAGADVHVFFLESYGATVFDDAQIRRLVTPSREGFAKAIDSLGLKVLSGFVRSPTFGGGSELAHLGFLSGLDLRDPFRHDLLLTTRRQTMVGYFRRNGYRTYGLYPSLSWDWPEKSFYGFDVFMDARDLGYTGAQFGSWWVPDQFAIARFEQLHASSANGPPRFVLFPTIMSHIPFAPVPPYQPDWQRLLSAEPFEPQAVREAMAFKPDWLNLRPDFARSMNYTYDWLSGYIARPRQRPLVLVLLGDHQPAASVSGPGASWDVPVHVLTSNAVLATRLEALGLVPGLEPRRPVLGDMHDFALQWLRSLDSSNCVGTVPACAGKP